MDIKKKTVSGGVEPAWSTYIHAKGSALGLPIAGNFELTTRCNFRCGMCYVHDNANTGELSAREWIELGKEAAGCGMVFLLLTGGEPLLREDFREIYTGLKKQGLLLSINTNGSLITDDLVEFFRKDPPLRMNVSLYGCSNETYECFCGQPAYDRVTENIRKLHAAGIQVRLNCSITPQNAGDIPALYRFAEEEGVILKATTYMFPPVRVNGCKYGDSPNRFTPEAAAEHMLLCREQYMTQEQLGRSWIGDPCGDEDCSDGQGDPMRCRAGRTAFWVTWDGRMLPCGMFPGEGYRLDQHGFRGAWEAVRQQCAQIRLPSACTTCGYRPVCSACAASCLTECGDMERAPEYICRMTAHLDRITREKYGREEPQNESK